MRTFLSITSLLLFLTPTAAVAQYITPEQMLNQSGYTDASVPRSRRQAQEAAQQQGLNANPDRPTVTEWWLKEGATEASTTSSAGGTDEPFIDEQTEEDDPSVEPELDPVTARWLLRLQRASQQSQQPVIDPDTVLHSSALHSGAPLSGTGPASALAALAVAIAVGWTLWNARRSPRWLVRQ